MWTLIEANGMCVSSNSPTLRARLETDLGSELLAEYCAKTMGYAAIRTSRGRVHILLNPRLIVPVAFSELMYQIADQPTAVVVARLFDAGWKDEILGVAEQAVRTLSTRVARLQSMVRPSFKKHRIPLLTLNPEHVFAVAMKRQCRRSIWQPHMRARTEALWQPTLFLGNLDGTKPRPCGERVR